MNIKTIEHVEAEAKRFLSALVKVREIEQENVNRRVKSNMAANGHAYIVSGTRKHGAMRRAAHDLKEALTLVTQNKDII